MSKNNNEHMEIQSTFTIPFTQVQNEVIDNLGFDNPIDKLVYISLLRFAFGKGNAYPSISKLAMMNNSSENRIRQSISRLEDMNLVSVKKRFKVNGEPDTNIYYLNNLSLEQKQNTIMNNKAIDEFIQKEKERKAEKQKKKIENKAKKEAVKVTENVAEKPTSKNEPPTSNFEPPTSKNEVPTSNFEDEEYLSNNIHLIKRFNKYLSIFKEKEIKNVLVLRIERLIDDNIDIKIIKENYDLHKDKVTVKEYANILYNVLLYTKNPIRKIGLLMDVAIDDHLKKKNKTDNEVIPDWFKKQKEEGNKVGMDKQENEEISKIDLGEEKRKLQELLNKNTRGNTLATVKL